MIELFKEYSPHVLSLLSMIISCILGFYFRKREDNIKYDQEKKLAEQKQAFQRQFELEKIKSSGIYQKRMEAIIAINANIMDVYLSLKKYVSLKDNCSKYHEEHRKKAAEKIKLFWK